MLCPFYSFSCSDATSQLSGKGNTSAWNGCTTATAELTITSQTCIIYESLTSHTKLNDLRQDLFLMRVKMMAQLPPTESIVSGEIV